MTSQEKSEPEKDLSNSKVKTSLSFAVICLCLLSLILEIITLSIPYWGYIQPTEKMDTTQSLEGRGLFGPFHSCVYTQGGWSKACEGQKGVNIWFKTTAYIKIAGVFVVFGIVMNLVFGFLSGLNVFMIINKHDAFCLFGKNILARLVSLAFSIVATLLAVVFSSLEILNSPHHLQYGQCFYVEICVLLIKMVILVLVCINQRRKETENNLSGGNKKIEEEPEIRISVTRASGMFSEIDSAELTKIKKKRTQEEIINSNPGAGRINKMKNKAGSISTIDTYISVDSDISTGTMMTMPRRPSLKKEKKGNESLNSTTSSVSVRFNIGGEWTEI
eukprot:GFUD01038503.1.p1 GENE.GFUD01038503.1~~GFUD01038503.1.p1  ORF type:complete len:332 (+),score=66.89 GFUD01038503.1:48-1043(+)